MTSAPYFYPDWCLCQNHGKFTQESNDEGRKGAIYFNPLGPLHYSGDFCPGGIKRHRKATPLLGSKLSGGGGASDLRLLCSLPVCPQKLMNKLREADEFHLKLKKSCLGTPATSMAIPGKRKEQRGLLSATCIVWREKL